MRADPIVEEVHRIRDELAAALNYDIKAIFADLRERQKTVGNRLVPLHKEVSTTNSPAVHVATASES